MGSPLVILMAKAPRPGAVKTRLAADIGAGAATALYRALVERQLAALPGGWPVEVHYAPAGAGREMGEWLGGSLHYVPQCEGDLGDRLRFAFERGFGLGFATVIAIGGDCPDLGAQDLLEAGLRLREKDVVLGPAADGGYYLVGTRFPAPALFDGIPWSSARVLDTTLQRISQRGWSFDLLEAKEDIDDLGSLQRAGGLECLLAASS